MEIILSPRAAKQYKKIGAKDRKIDLLASDPHMGKALQGEYAGEYSIRAWPLRIIYTFDSENQIIQIENIDYRGSIYKN